MNIEYTGLASEEYMYMVQINLEIIDWGSFKLFHRDLNLTISMITFQFSVILRQKKADQVLNHTPNHQTFQFLFTFLKTSKNAHADKICS